MGDAVAVKRWSRVAEGEGFEPSRRLNTPYSLSRRALSAAQSSLRWAGQCKRGVPSRAWIPSKRSTASRRCSSASAPVATRSRRSASAADAIRDVPVDELAGARGAGAHREPPRVGSSTGEVIEQALAGEVPRVPGAARGGSRARLRARRGDPRRARRRPAPALQLVRRRRHDRSDGAQGGRARARVHRAHRPLAAAHGGARASRRNGCVSSSRSSPRLNDELAPFRILTGIEVDILDDGSLDQDDDLLAELDVVVASVHSKLRMGEQPMTDRMVAAMANPNTDILGHCTGRLVVGKGRPESTFDAELVFGVCAHFDKAVEINCRPERLDPPMRLLEQRRRRRLQGVDRQRRPRGRAARVAALRVCAGSRGRRRHRADRQHVAGRPAPRVDRFARLTRPARLDGTTFRVRNHTKSGRAPKQQRATSGVTPEVPSSG